MLKLINRFLRWRSYRRKLQIRYRVVTGKPKASVFLLQSETIELIITEHTLFGGRDLDERERDKWDNLLNDV